MGMAAAARPNMLVPSEARVTLAGDRATVETDMTDIGTGTYAILSQIAAEMLGLPAANVTATLGDTDLPGASGSGGSFGAGSSGSSVFLAAKALRGKIAALMGADEADLTLKDGLARAGNVETRLADLVAEPIAATAKIEGGRMAKETHQSGYGAHFCEVAVHALTGEIRVRRFEGTFAAGRILNEKTARSQCIGGIVWGIGAALTEELVHDDRTGQPVTRDLASYHVPAHADVPQIGVTFLGERDDAANPIQAKGVGELGISGAGAAVLNAVANATGRQQRRAEQEAEALHRVLRAGQHRHPAEQPAPARGRQQLDRGLRGHLGQVLGHARNALHAHHEGDRGRHRPARIELRQRQERGNLQRQPGIECRCQPEARRDPARAEIGGHARQLVEQEEIGELHRAEAQRVEMQQHQHPQRAVGEHEGPIGRRHRDIGREPLGPRRHSAAPTISATSTSRFA